MFVSCMWSLVQRDLMDSSYIIFQRNQPQALLVSPHDQKLQDETSSICQVLSLSNALYIYIYIYYCHKQTHVIKMKPFQNVWNRPSSLRCYSQCRLCVMWPEEGRSSCWTIAVLIRFLTLWWRISTQCLCQSLLSRAALLRTTHPLEKVKRLYLNNRLNHLLNLLIMHF